MYYAMKGLCVLILSTGLVICQSIIETPDTRPSSDLNATLSIIDDLCAALPDGSYPDYNQACRMFFVCASGRRAATFWCTKGHVFSARSNRCLPPEGAICPDRNHVTPLDAVLQLQAEAADPVCLQGDGVYPEFKQGCREFFVCRGGIKTTFKCPGSTTFDWRTKSCRESDIPVCFPLDCKDKEDGIYIDSNSYCKRYFECRGGNISEFVCPEGTIYNARHHRCTRSSNTRCHGLESTQCVGLPDGYYPDFTTDCKIFGLCMSGGLKTYNCPTNSSFDSKTMACEKNVLCPKPDINICSGKYNGIHPIYETGCKDFYMCHDELLTHQGSCPRGRILNLRNGNCQSSSLVTCSPVVDADCDGLVDGVYPDFDTGCSAYFICLGKRRISTAYCTGSDLFDLATGRCLPSSYVLCRERTTYMSPPRLFDTYNCDNRIGIFPEFSSDCRRYVTCANGQLRIQDCPTGTYFDPETNECSRTRWNCDAPFAVASFQCLPGDDGIYVGSNCSQWHECRNGVGFTNVCPKGLHYHIQLSKCVRKADVCPKDFQIQKRMFHSMDVVPTEIRDTDFKCSMEGIGTYGDSSSCSRFHFCVNGMKTSYSCPSNFSYNMETMRCTRAKETTGCKNTNSRRHDDSQPPFSCSYLENGMYVDYKTDCRRYFVCENGKGVPVYCPDRQKFNVIKMTCEREDYVLCSSTAHYSTNPPVRKPYRQTDDIYHVFSPDELNSETYTYIITTETPRPSEEETVVWEEYDIVPLQNARPNNRVTNTRVSNTVEPNTRVTNPLRSDVTIRRQYPPKHIHHHHSSNRVPTPTAPPHHNTDDDISVKQQHAKANNRDIDIACRKGDTGFLPDYGSGCKLFHICFRTIRKTYSCPSVLLFNPDTKNCDMPENVVCIRPEPLIDTPFDCRENLNRLVPDYESGCRTYIGCIKDLPYRYTCPRGKMFNAVSKACEEESTVACREPQIYNVTATTSTVKQDNPSFRHVHGIPGQFFFSCVHRADGFYPDFNRHCHVFYRCVKGKKFSHYCKQGMLFNPESGMCDFEDNVACKPIYRTTTSS